MSSSVRDIAESREAEGRDDTHQSWARHVPSQCGNAGYKRFLTRMSHSDLYLATVHTQNSSGERLSCLESAPPTLPNAPPPKPNTHCAHSNESTTPGGLGRRI